jgi:NADH-quinone oxidoreductase subunit F
MLASIKGYGVLLPSGAFEGEESLEAYRARGGYEALKKALGSGTPDEVLAAVEASGLRGRGGAAFPTGKKWRLAREGGPSPRYLVVNGGEDEPGSLKDRVLMESFPHLVLEGVILAAYAVGAEQAYFYVNAKYEHAISSFQGAISQAKEAGYLSHDSFKVECTITPAPSEYVAGEDTAALEVIEGKKALPRQKPPYPTTAGLFGRPTVVNNAETFANVPGIALHGPEWYKTMGSGGDFGTVLFSLGKEMNRPGVYELPLGTPLRDLIEKHGSGLRDGKRLKAVQPGGPSSAFLLPGQIDVPLTYGALAKAGSALGCGVVRCVAEGTCMVEEVLKLAGFFAKESCGQCPACRMETGMLKAILEKIQRGEASGEIADQVSKVAEYAKGKGLCSFIGMPVPPVQSALKLFKEDFDSHLIHKRCPA